MKRGLLLFLMSVIGLGASAQTVSREYDVLFHEALLQRLKHHHAAAYDLLNRCLEIDSTASEAYYFRGQYYAEMRQVDKALADYKKAVSLCPDNMTMLEELAHCYMVNRQYADAIPIVEHMYDVDKSRQELLQTLYRLYLEEENYDDAIGVLDRLEVIDGKSESTSIAKSGLYIQMGENEQALQEVKTLSEAHPSDMNYKTLYANTLMMNNREDEAFALLKDILREEPDNVKAQMSLRNYYVSQEDSISADSIARSLLLNAKTPQEYKISQLRQLIGESESSGGDSTRILQLLDEMVTMPEVDPDIAEFRAAYMELKKMPRDTVTRAFEQVLALAPDRASSRLRLVQYAWEASDHQRIVDLCGAARQYNPDEMAFYYYQGIAYYQLKDIDHALEAFKNGISVINEDSPTEIVSDFYSVMGDLLFQKNQEKEAFAAYDSCLQWKADNIGCLNNYAYYLSLKGIRLKEAEEMSYKTVKAEPENATYLDTYAWILFMEGRYAEAKVYIEQALQSNPDVDGVVKEHAGDIFAMNGDMDRALQLWNEALQEEPGKKLLLKKIKKKKYIKEK